jgi:hypothetical protein
MATFTGTREFEGAQFTDVSLRGVRITNATLVGAVMRGVDVTDLDIDAPWLDEPGAHLWVNGVDVAPMVEAELNRRFPGRDQRRAPDPDGLRRAWDAVQTTWDAAIERAQAMSDGTVDACVDGEWSFSQTLRHLVMATDVWLRRTVQGEPQPFHPLGQPNVEYESDGYDMSVFAPGTPSFADVLDARVGRVAMVREFLATVSVDDLQEPRANPWDPSHSETVRSCLHVILHEEWEHLRFALRDLDALERHGRVEP